MGAAAAAHQMIWGTLICSGMHSVCQSPCMQPPSPAHCTGVCYCLVEAHPCERPLQHMLTCCARPALTRVLLLLSWLPAFPLFLYRAQKQWHTAAMAQRGINPEQATKLYCAGMAAQLALAMHRWLGSAVSGFAVTLQCCIWSALTKEQACPLLP